MSREQERAAELAKALREALEQAATAGLAPAEMLLQVAEASLGIGLLGTARAALEALLRALPADHPQRDELVRMLAQVTERAAREPVGEQERLSKLIAAELRRAPPSFADALLPPEGPRTPVEVQAALRRLRDLRGGEGAAARAKAAAEELREEAEAARLLGSLPPGAPHRADVAKLMAEFTKDGPVLRGMLTRLPGARRDPAEAGEARQAPRPVSPADAVAPDEAPVAPGYLLMAAQDGELTPAETAALEDRMAGADPALRLEWAWLERARAALARVGPAVPTAAELDRLRAGVRDRLAAPAAPGGPPARRKALALRRPDVEVVVRHLAPAGTGEDVVDLIDGPTGVDVVLLDPSGRGPDAVRAAALVQGALRGLLRGLAAPHDALAAANRAVFGALPSGTFVSATVARWRGGDGRVRLGGGGAEPALLVRADGRVEPLELRGCALGLAAELPRRDEAQDDELREALASTLDDLFGEPGDEEQPLSSALDDFFGSLGRTATREDEVQLGPGDALVLVSDGITCAGDAHGVAFDEGGLRRALAGRAGDAEALADRVFAAVERHAGGRVEDDLVVAVLRRPG